MVTVREIFYGHHMAQAHQQWSQIKTLRSFLKNKEPIQKKKEYGPYLEFSANQASSMPWQYLAIKAGEKRSILSIHILAIISKTPIRPLF